MYYNKTFKIYRMLAEKPDFISRYIEAEKPSWVSHAVRLKNHRHKAPSVSN